MHLSIIDNWCKVYGAMEDTYMYETFSQEKTGGRGGWMNPFFQQDLHWQTNLKLDDQVKEHLKREIPMLDIL